MAHTNSNLTRRWILIALLTLLLVLWAVGLASSQTVHLQRTARIDAALLQQQGGVTLGDVADLADFSDGESVALRSLIVIPAAEPMRRISLGEVRDALRQAGVNLGLLTLRGFATCDLQLVGPAEVTNMTVPETSKRELQSPCRPKLQSAMK